MTEIYRPRQQKQRNSRSFRERQEQGDLSASTSEAEQGSRRESGKKHEAMERKVIETRWPRGIVSPLLRMSCFANEMPCVKRHLASPLIRYIDRGGSQMLSRRATSRATRVGTVGDDMELQWESERQGEVGVVAVVETKSIRQPDPSETPSTQSSQKPTSSTCGRQPSPGT